MPNADRELAKWPRILVIGRDVTEEQADQVLVRTTDLGFESHDDRWNVEVRGVFGLHLEAGHSFPDFDNLERANRRHGILDLRYVNNEQIFTSAPIGPNGWCGWDGKIGTTSMTVAQKRPTLRDMTEEWRIVAGAFPFLSLTAQAINTLWGEGDIEGYQPLATWTIDSGYVDLHDTPGRLIAEPADVSAISDEYYRRVRAGDPVDQPVSAERLRQAAARCLLS